MSAICFYRDADVDRKKDSCDNVICEQEKGHLLKSQVCPNENEMDAICVHRYEDNLELSLSEKVAQTILGLPTVSNGILIHTESIPC